MKTEAEIKVQRSEINRRWRAENKERVREHSKKYRDKNPEYQKTYQQQWRSSKPNYQKQWRDQNPDKSNALRRFRYGALKNSIPGWFEDELVAQIYKKRDELNDLYDLRLEVDHIIPINPRDKSVCGLHCWANLQLLDKSINSTKNDNYQRDW